MSCGGAARALAGQPARAARAQNIATSAPEGVKPQEGPRAARPPAYGPAAFPAAACRRGDNAPASAHKQDIATSAPQGVRPQEDTHSSRSHGSVPDLSSTIVAWHLDILRDRQLQHLGPDTVSWLATDDHDRPRTRHRFRGPFRTNAVSSTTRPRPLLASGTQALRLVPFASATTRTATTVLPPPGRTSPPTAATPTTPPSPLGFPQSQIQGHTPTTHPCPLALLQTPIQGDTSAPGGAGQPGPVEGGRR